MEKLKNLSKEQKIIVAVVATVLVVGLVIGAVLLLGGNSGSGDGSESGDTTAGVKTYSVEVKTEGGKAFEKLEIHVFEDNTLTDLVAVGKTDENGKYTFEAEVSNKYVAVLKNMPAGYPIEEMYAFTDEAISLSLKASLISADEAETLKLGAVAADMTVTVDGKNYTISELLKEKKAVVLNFWFEGCDPCRVEFPYMEEAYQQYSDKLEILAVNPYDGDDASVAAYKADMGLSFPMAKADVKYASVYNVMAYPTTVVIDRYGTIGFMHTGSVTDANSFVQLFEYFTSDNYVQSTVRNLEDIVEKVEGGEGSKESPFEEHRNEFEVEVAAGAEVYYQMYHVDGMILEIANPNVYVIYNDKKYEAVDGKVSLVLSTSDTYTPAIFAIGNAGTDTQKCPVTLSFVEGTAGNPYSMELGDFGVNVAAGNEQGVYYIYTATENGTLKLNCTSVSNGVKYDFTLYNLNSYALRNLSSDGDNDTTVSIAVNAGDAIQVSVGTLPNEDNEYPAAEFTFNASFEAGEGTGIDPNATVDYKVTVEDTSGKPVSGVTVRLNADGAIDTIKTDASGVAAITLRGGNYIVTVTAPDGYKEDTTEYILTKIDNQITITLEKKVTEKKTYTVKVVDEAGNAIKDVSVTVGNSYGKTDSKGTVTFSLAEDAYSVSVSASGYTTDGKTYDFSKGTTSLTVTLKKETVQVKEIEYKITVKDYQGKSISGVSVRFKNGDAVVASQNTNASGVVTAKLPEGSYTAVVVDNTYGSGTVGLTAKKASAELVAAKKMDTSKGVEEYFGMTYPISEGAVYVELNANSENYFMFRPTKAGEYEIKTTSTDAKLAPCGSSAFVYTPTYEGNVYKTEVKSGMVGGDIAISVTGTSGAIIVVTRTGDASETIYREYEGSKAPVNFTLTSGGNNLTYVNVAASSFNIVLGSDGYYHKGSATGPIVYVNLGPNAPYLSLQTMIAGSGHAGGAPLVSYTTENGQQVRIDYSNFMMAHFECMDQTYGVYPLTEDLKYVLQTAGGYTGWWDSTNANNAYLFSSVKNLNTDIAWMFACCYVE